MEKAKTEARLAEQEAQLTAREEKLAKADKNAMSRLEASFKEVKLGTEDRSALTKLQEDSEAANSTLSAIKDNATKIPEVAQKLEDAAKDNAAKLDDVQTQVAMIPDVAQKLEDAAKERAQQPPMLTAISQIMDAKMATMTDQLKEMLNARPTGVQDPPDWSQQLGSQRTFAPQQSRQGTSTANSSQPQGTSAANSSQPQGTSTPGTGSSRKRQRTSTGAVC